MKRQDFRFAHRLRVRWVEVDMQQIVFNGHYLMYFDTAVTDYWRSLAMPYAATMHQLGGDLYVKKASVEYHASAEMDDFLEVCMRCDRIGNSSMTFVGAIFRGDELLITSELVYVYADPVAKKSQAIPPALRDKVFDRFFQAPGAAPGGSGLGLAIVREVAERHQAQVRLLDGADGRGLRVRVEFPAAP